MSDAFHPVQSGDRELRFKKFPVEGVNMIKLFQRKVQLTTKNKDYTYREAIYDMIEFAYTQLVEKKSKRRKL